MKRLSVYIPVRNEEKRIRAALESVRWADEILLVDTGCSDRTIEIAREYTDRVVEIPFEGFGAMRNEAVSRCRYEWILSLDADERCTPELKREIQAVLDSDDACEAYFIPRRNFFMGRPIKHCGWYPDYCQPKLFRKGALRYRNDEVHEGFDVQGRIGRLEHDILHDSFHSLSQMIDKMNRYSTLGMQKMVRRGRRASMIQALLHGLGAFLRIYVLKLGFLDGWPGFIIALGNFEGTFYRYAKLALREFETPDP